jgi:hypothetical protein
MAVVYLAFRLRATSPAARAGDAGAAGFFRRGGPPFA